MTEPAGKGNSKRQKRAAMKTALLLAAVVFGIYLFFIGRAFFNYSGA